MTWASTGAARSVESATRRAGVRIFWEEGYQRNVRRIVRQVSEMRRFFTLLALGVAACGRVQVSPTPATDDVSARDLETRLTAFAHDSMMGREAGTIWNLKATDYVASEFRALGVRPAGDGGGFFQIVEGIRPSD